MPFHLTISIPEEQKRFIDERNISPSKIFQDSVNSLMKDLDPELYQETIAKFEKNNKAKETLWQRRLAEEPDPDKRKMIIFDVLDGFGIDTSDWKERRELDGNKTRDVE